MAIAGNPSVNPMSPYDQRLASLPAAPRKTSAGDGTEPGGSGSASGAPAAPPNGQTADERANTQIAAPPGKTLTDADPPTLFKAVESLVRSQDPIARNRWAIDTHFTRVRSNIPFSRLEKIPNQSVWVAKLPDGMSKESSAAVPNKADDLCNKVEDTLMADPAKIIARPHVTDESATAASKLASRFLADDGGPNGTDDIATYRWALNNAFHRAASILHYIVDRSGGGYQPLQKMAHPKATDPANPLVAQIPGPVDPMTGQPGPPITENAGNPILRYVSAPTPQAPAGQFVEDASQADRVWLPKIVIERHRRESVRCFPANASVENAIAVIFIRNCNLGDARSAWPDTVGRMTQEQLMALAGWKPTMSDLTVPYAFRSQGESGGTGPSLEDVGSLSPLLQRRMFSYRLYVRSSPEYPQGFWCDVNGADGGMVLGQGDLEYTVQLPTAGKENRCRDIPGVQVRPMMDVSGGDPMGWPFISRFAGSSEATATLLAAFMDVCDNMLHPHVFIPSLTEISEDEWFDRSLPTVISPDSKGPFYEQFPTLPPILQLVQELHKEDDTISGLTATAQGLDSSNAVSGTAKNATIRQALVALSGFQQNLHAAQTRGARIKCQIVQAEWTTPQLMDDTGEGGSEEAQWWTGENVAGVEDRLGLQPGTGTMMTPEGKAQYVAFLQSQQWLRPDEGAEVSLPGIRVDLGLPENPFEQAIERAVGVFLKGPPPGWMEAQAAYVQQQQAFEAEQAQIQAGQQSAAITQQQQIAQAPLEAQHAQAMQIKQQDQEHQAAIEQQKAQTTLQLEEAKHRMTMEQKQADAQIAQSTPAPQTPPEIVVQPPDLTPIVAAIDEMRNLVAAVLSKEPAPQSPSEPHVFHVHPSPAPNVAVAPAQVHVSPQIHVPQQPAPAVHVSTPAPGKRKARKGTITNAKGEKHTIEVEGDE